MAAKSPRTEGLIAENLISRAEIDARQEDRSLVLLDVMPREVFAGGHIPGSINLPAAKIEAKARAMVSNLAQEIAVYCAGPT